MSLFSFSYIALWLITLVLALLILLIYRQFGIVYMKESEGVSRSGLSVGKKILDYNWKTISGDIIELKKIKEPFVLLFTSPKCGPCKDMLGKLNNYIANYPKLKIIVVSIDHSEDDEVIPLRCPVVTLSSRKEFEDDFKGEVTPFGFIISEEMKVLSKGVITDPKNIEFLINSTSKDALKNHLANASIS